MKRVQTGAYFHLFYFIYRFAIRKHQPAFCQIRTTIWKIIFNHQIFRFFRIDKRCYICILRCDHRFQFFHSILLQNLFYRSIWSWSDLIDHAPCKRNFIRVNIFFKSFFCFFVFCPCFRKSRNGYI